MGINDLFVVDNKFQNNYYSFKLV